MKRVALPVETKVRELNGKVWLAATLAKRGYKVALGELTNIKLNLDRIKPNIYIGDSAVHKPSRIELYSRLKNANVSVAVHDTEGGIIYSRDYYKGRLSVDVLPYVDCFLAWGNESRSIFREVWPDERVALAPVGNPSFDLLSRRCRNFYAAEQVEIIEKFGRFVLVNTHFGFYNHFDREKYIDPVMDKFPGLYEFKKELYYSFLDALHTLSLSMRDVNFVIRPHPSENFDSYKKEFKGTDNVFVEHERSVHPWILASKAVIHNGCTTGVETALLEKPAIAYRPVQNKTWDVFLPNYVSQEVFEVSELERVVDNYCSEGASGRCELPLEKKEVLENILHTLDGRTVDRIADTFDKLPIDEEIAIGRLGKQSLKSNIISGVRKILPGRVIFNNKAKNDYAKQKFDHLTLEEIESLLIRYRELETSLADVKVEPLDNHTGMYWIYKR